MEKTFFFFFLFLSFNLSWIFSGADQQVLPLTTGSDYSKQCMVLLEFANETFQDVTDTVEAVDCVLQSTWEELRGCNATCDSPGFVVEFKRIEQFPRYGGLCPLEGRVRYTACDQLACNSSCVLSEWSFPSECTWDLTQVATREVVKEATGSGTPCSEYNLTQTMDCYPEVDLIPTIDTFEVALNDVTYDTITVTLGFEEDEGVIHTLTLDVNKKPDCSVTEWSLWTKCSADCTPGGYEYRFRDLVTGTNVNACIPPELMESRECNTETECVFSFPEPSTGCLGSHETRQIRSSTATYGIQQTFIS